MSNSCQVEGIVRFTEVTWAFVPVNFKDVNWASVWYGRVFVHSGLVHPSFPQILTSSCFCLSLLYSKNSAASSSA